MITTRSLNDVLLDSAREVFETMVFMTLEDCPDPMPGEQAEAAGTQSLSPLLLASITFKGNLEGCLGICCNEFCARTIAANMLGLPPVVQRPFGSRASDRPAPEARRAAALGAEAAPGGGPASADDVSDDDVSDAMGEIANMVMGAVKTRIQDEVGTIEVSIPSVVQGRELKNGLGERAGHVKVRVSIEEQYSVGFSLLYREGTK